MASQGGQLGAGLGMLVGCQSDDGNDIACNVISLSIDMPMSCSGLSRVPPEEEACQQVVASKGGRLGASLGTLVGCQCDDGTGIACNVISLSIDMPTSYLGLSWGLTRPPHRPDKCLPAGCGKHSCAAWGLLGRHVGCQCDDGNGIACNVISLSIDMPMGCSGLSRVPPEEEACQQVVASNGGRLGVGLGTLVGCHCDDGTGIACNVISLSIDMPTSCLGLSWGLTRPDKCLLAGCGKHMWAVWGLLGRHVGCQEIGDGVACNAKAFEQMINPRVAQARFDGCTLHKF